MVVPNAANTPAVVARLEVSAAALAAECLQDRRSTSPRAVDGPGALAVDSAALDTFVAGIRTRPCASCRRTVRGCSVAAPATPANPAGAGARRWLAGPLWDGLLDGGATPCGLAARDTLRLEMGYPLHGNELAAT